MEIPGLLDKQVIEIIQQWKQDIRDQDTSNGIVQIPESMVGECKNQLITVSEEGVRKLHRCNSQAEQEGAGRKWQEFPTASWDTIHGEITERECKS